MIRHSGPRRDATPLIWVMVCVTLALVIGLIGVSSAFLYKPAIVGTQSVAPAPQPIAVDPVVLHTQWKEAVARSVAPLVVSSSTDEIQRALNAILALRVTSSDRDAHLQLVLALSAFAHQEVGAYDKVREAFISTQK